ncbi:MAG: hypothetical protein LBD59_03535 [Prevotellaceae bacterium]|nr:hypothetical protein [Prevotellaceae bacterium]
MSVRKLGYTQPPSRRDGMLVENASPTSQPPSRQRWNVEFVDLMCRVQGRGAINRAPTPPVNKNKFHLV